MDDQPPARPSPDRDRLPGGDAAADRGRSAVPRGDAAHIPFWISRSGSSSGPVATMAHLWLTAEAPKPTWTPLPAPEPNVSIATALPTPTWPPSP
jgi:hypothetical protein